MAYVIEGGDAAFDAMVYGEHHQGTVAFLDNQRNKVRNYLTDTAQRFKARAETLLDRYDASAAFRMTRAVARKMANCWNADVIAPLQNIGEIQHSKITMQRWIMAEPTVRTAYHRNTCDGFSDSYIDIQPTEVGAGHYDYRRATNAVFFNAGNNKPLESVTYYETLKPDDRALHALEQADILFTWRSVKEHMDAGGEDPTSVYNAML